MDTNESKESSAEDSKALQDGWVTTGAARKPAAASEPLALVRSTESWNWERRLQDGWDKGK